jgi:AbrB family looped-hinge helix DNA binding protein
MRMKIYNKGQVLIPTSLRKRYNLNIGDYVNVETEDNSIKITPVRKNRVTDDLFGILAGKSHKTSIPDKEDINTITESEFVKDWVADNESD